MAIQFPNKEDYISLLNQNSKKSKKKIALLPQMEHRNFSLFILFFYCIPLLFGSCITFNKG